jgi:glucosamine--fructose-6-phosphate aminotransferase (isomerizing)
MCGIVGYIGHRQAAPILLDGLRRLEYRGYDSAGLAVLDGEGGIWSRKAVGRVDALAEQMIHPPTTPIGIAHTRWATHGGVTQPNAHPHFDETGRIAVIHNGIIENMSQLKEALVAKGVVFRSETDTEIIPHLIRRHYQGDPLAAVVATLRQLQGTWGIAVLFADHPDRIIVARNGSPLVIGLGEGETVIASDPQPIVGLTRRVVYLQDREIAVMTADGVDVQRLDGGHVQSNVAEISEDYVVADREGFPHFMLKEIHEQPRSVNRALAGRIHLEDGNARLGGLNMSPRDLVAVKRVITIGCGTSYHAGMAGAMAIEALARVPARAEIASEFRYRHPIVDPEALFIAISQSGETADTLGAVQEVQIKGGDVIGMVNVVGSTIARTCGRGVYLHSGPEIAVASTKAFTSQVTAMLVLTLMLARTRTLSIVQGHEMAVELNRASGLIAAYLANPGPIAEVVARIQSARYVLFLGRGYSYPVALEGALKLKEIAYVPCEAYPAGEMKHGPIAMLEQGTPVVFIIPQDEHREKAISNVKEVQARGAFVIAIHTAGDEEVRSLASISIPVPKIASYASPLLTVLPLQLIAYHAGLALGRDVDKPRNLAKSVTVE